MKKIPKHIVWLPSGGQIGDALMTLAALVEALEFDPALRVTYLARRNARIIADLAAAYPRITVVAVPRNPLRALPLVLSLFVRGRYVVVVPPTPGSHPKEVKSMAFLFGLIPGNFVIGCSDRGSFEPYDTVLTLDVPVRPIDVVRRILRAAEFRVQDHGTPPCLNFQTSIPEDFSLAPHSYIVIHPFSTLPSKTLPMRRWRALLFKLAQDYPELSLIITGAKQNEAEAQEMVRDIPRTQLAVNLPILEVAGIIERAAVYIGVDTGITHLAGIIQKKSVILGQNSSPLWLPTYNPNGTVLLNMERCTCPNLQHDCLVEEDRSYYYRCLYDIDDGAILTAVQKTLS